jgi:SH3-like domain-containing protein
MLMFLDSVSASHFFVGLGAGIAILAVPVLTLTPAAELPHRLLAWIDGPSTSVAGVNTDDVAISRPQRGYRAGDPTPGPEAPPTLSPIVAPTPVPRVQSAPPLQAVPIGGATLRTGVIRSGGLPVFVRRVAGVESGDDALIADGSPVLVSTGAGLQVGAEQWRAIRGLSGVVGWVPASQLAVDGEAPAQMTAASVPSGASQSLAAPATPGATGGGERGVIANTDGVGVVLRNSPAEADRSTRGLMDGMAVTVVEHAGTDWVRVQAANGLSGWIPTRYVVAESG